MAVLPISAGRVSHNLQAMNLLEAVRRNQLNLLGVQSELASGLRILRPSDDPLRASAASVVQRKLEELQQVQRNLQKANSVLDAGDSALAEAVSLLTQARQIVIQAAGDTLSADERRALLPEVQSLLDQLVAVANREHLGTYLFAGRYADGRPFELTADGVLYRGDDGRSWAAVDSDLSSASFTLSGAECFGAVSTAIRGTVDLDPGLTRQVRITDLRGATGQGVRLGQISVSDGNVEVTIDLAGVDTVGQLVDRLNAGLPATLRAELTSRGIRIVSALGGPVAVTVRDVGGGQAAQDLGLAAEALGAPVGGADLDPKLTLQTRIEDLRGGAGIDLSNGLVIRNGSRSATLDFSSAETVEDVLNIINRAGLGVWARISADGRTLEVLNRISGSDLSIGEAGGSLAASLGIRSLHGGTLLSSLNDGRGVQTVEGSDLRVVTADGSTFEVDLDGAQTIQDVIDRLNAAGAGAISASLAPTGNGLVIVDNTVGAGSLRIERANLSPALGDLGLDVESSGQAIIGRDVGPVRTDSVFTALLELARALEEDDRRGITLAGQRLERALERLQQMQGTLAAQARAMQGRAELVETELDASRVLLSDLRDADLADSLVRFQQVQVALQASLSSAARLMSVSLLDYLP
jgi:flagellar hook-associated protein 3 FlgL